MEYIENRAFLIITYKEPFREWVNSFEEEEVLSAEEMTDHKSIYLVKHLVDTASEKVEKLVRKQSAKIFENELFEWYTDKKMWPGKKQMTFTTFNEWFGWEFADSGIDLAKGEILKSD